MSRVLEFLAPPGRTMLRGNDHYWQMIRELGAEDRGWTVSDIIARSSGARVHRSTVREFVQRLAKGGFVEAVEPTGSETTYRLLRSQIATPCLRKDGTAGTQGRGQAAMWNVLRGPLGRGGVTAVELGLYATTKDAYVAPRSAAKYLQHLDRAGYLQCVREGKPHRAAVFRLKPAFAQGNPLPPIILTGSIVFDQNTGEAVGPVEAREVEP